MTGKMVVVNESQLGAVVDEFLVWTEVVQDEINNWQLLGPYPVKEEDLEEHVKQQRIRFEIYKPMPGSIYKFSRCIILGPIGVLK